MEGYRCVRVRGLETGRGRVRNGGKEEWRVRVTANYIRTRQSKDRLRHSLSHAVSCYEQGFLFLDTQLVVSLFHCHQLAKGGRHEVARGNQESGF